MSVADSGLLQVQGWECCQRQRLVQDWPCCQQMRATSVAVVSLWLMALQMAPHPRMPPPLQLRMQDGTRTPVQGMPGDGCTRCAAGVAWQLFQDPLFVTSWL
jgi:hypothetical protein